MTDMLKNLEKINTSDTYVKSDNLTEQWKNGKLPEGHYYVKDGKDLIAEYLDGFFYIYGEPTRVDKILGPVPSYEKWQRILEENKQIKELLKDCLNTVYSDCSVLYLVKLSEKIDQVLGEDK